MSEVFTEDYTVVKAGGVEHKVGMLYAMQYLVLAKMLSKVVRVSTADKISDQAFILQALGALGPEDYQAVLGTILRCKDTSVLERIKLDELADIVEVLVKYNPVEYIEKNVQRVMGAFAGTPKTTPTV